MTSQEIQSHIDTMDKFGVDEISNPTTLARATWELALQHAIRNELLRETNAMSRESLENWNQDAAERKAALDKMTADGEKAISRVEASFHGACENMLYALRSALPALEQGKEFQGEVLEVAAQVREAITKAEGRSH